MKDMDAGKDVVPRAEDLYFRVLGRLEVWANGVRLRLGGAIQERVLATLLLECGRVVPVAKLIEAAWEGNPPATAVHQVRKAVADLRRRLPDGGSTILTDGPGYRTVVSPGGLDLLEFEARLQAAAQAAGAGRPEEACTDLQGALDLWQGTVLADAGGSVIGLAAAALDERRLNAAEQLYDLQLGLGQAGELIPELRALISANPLRETLRGQLMLALYRSGRQAEALEEYARVRELLADELGVDPGRQLVQLHEGILRESPELTGSPGETTTASAAPVAPRGPICTLPYALPDFTGRNDELASLLRHVRSAEPLGTPGTRVHAIDGMGGSGKTSLAVCAAHQLSDEFPDGQLYVNLHGFTPGSQSMVSASAALDILLRAVGVPGDRIPEDLPGREAEWRVAISGRRMLLLLDNASDVAQVRPLISASPNCLILITSRVRLLDLDGIEWHSLGTMAPKDSAALVTRMLGPDRVAAEPDATVELATLCGHLPLALRIATTRLRNRPRWTIRYLVERLRDESRRMDELSSGERSVAATLQLSYLAMDDRHREAFRSLALHPSPRIDGYSAAALLDTDLRGAEYILELLLDAQLLQQPELGAYTFHDLVRSFAGSRRGPSTERTDAAAVERLVRYYHTATGTACDALFTGRAHHSTGIEEYAGELPELTDEKSARLWFAHEHQGLLAVIDLADRLAQDRHVGWLIRNVAFHLYAGGYLEEFHELARRATRAARRLDDPVLLSVSLSNLAAACWKLGRFEEGIDVAREGCDIAVRLENRDTEAHCESTLGLLLLMLGRYAEALPRMKRAIEVAREIGASRAEAETQTNLSSLYTRWGRYGEATAAAHQALELTRISPDPVNETMALADLAAAQMGMGQYADAHESLRRAREICDESGPPGDTALVLALSAVVAHQMGDTHAVPYWAERALALARCGGTPVRQAYTENILGRLRNAQGQHTAAMALHSHALEIASAIRFRSEEASAHLGLSRAAAGVGDTSTARAHQVAATKLFDLMELPDTSRSH
ncbi:AfsR/SARP family transcriptional regulator [Streptomyces sp. NPDC002206]